jgi:RHS repeat-associated protein
MLSPRRDRYLARFTIVLVLVALIAGMVGCASPAEEEEEEEEELQQAPKNNPLTLGGAGSVLGHSGEFIWQVDDMTVPGRGFPFQFSRTYHSFSDYDGPLGYGWTHSYDQRLSGSAENDITLYDGTGRQDAYTWAETEYVAPAGFYDELEYQSATDTFTITDRFGTVRGFAMKGTFYKLIEIKDSNENILTLNYDASNRLSTIVDTLGRIISFAYTPEGRIDYFTDFYDPASPRKVNFTYDTKGDLWKVTLPITSDYPSGKTTTYSYLSGQANPALSHNLQSITNPCGETFLVNIYDNSDRVIEQQYGTPTQYYHFSYQPGKTVETDRNGDITEYDLTPAGNCASEIEYTNREIRPGEGDYLTIYTYNSNFELTNITFPGGNSEEYIFDISNPDPLARGNLLEIRQKSHIPGETDIVTSLTYESHFNQVKTSTDPRGYTTTNYFDYEEATLGDLNGDGITTQAHGNIVEIKYPDVTLGQPTPQIIEQRFWWNDYGQMIREINPEGNIDVYEYYTSGDMKGYLWKIIRAFGTLNLATEYTYDRVGNILTTKDPKGNITTFTINELNQVTQTQAPIPFSNYITKYYYDCCDNLVQIDVQNVDENGDVSSTNPWFTTTYTYDILDQKTSKTEKASPTVTTQYDYDANQNLIRITQPKGNEIFNLYDERDLVYQITRGEGSPEASTITHNYDGNQNLNTSIDAIGNTITYSYDGFNRLVETLDALGNKQIKVYDKNSNLIQTKSEGPLNRATLGNIRLSETNFAYDELNRNYQIESAFFNPATQLPYLDGQSTTRYFYDKNSRLAEVIDDNNHQILYEYDGADRQKKTIDHLTNEIENIYDQNSNVVQIIRREKSQLGNPEQTFITNNTYDNENRLTQTIDNIGNTNQYAYDSRNNLVLSTDAKGNTVHYEYDDLKRLIKTTYDLRAGGGAPGSITDTIVTRQAWDENSRLLSNTDDNGNTITYSYDDLNRLTLTTYPDGTTTSSIYDANDNVVNLTDQNGTLVTNTYDKLNRLINRSIVPAPGVGGTTSETYGYDGLSRTTLAEDNDSTVIFTYDSLGNIRSENQNGKTISSSYDGVSNRINLIYPSSRSFTQVFDALNRIQQINESSNTIADYKYIGPSSRVEQRDYLNGTRFTPTYDGIQRVTRVLHEKLSPLTTIADFQYGYDQEDNLLYEKKNHSPWNGKGDRYEYDSIYQVIKGKIGIDGPVGNTGSVSTLIDYNFDGVCNRLSVVTNGTAENYLMNANNPPADFQVNQYTQVAGHSYTYDANGNMLKDGKRNFTYQYDYRNQLIKVIDSAALTIIVEYKYDALGRRIEKIRSGAITKYYLDGAREVEERDGSDSVQATYVFGNGIDEVLQMQRGANTYYYHENSLGSISHVTDSSGNIVEKYDYDPFGQVTIRNSSDVIISNSNISNHFMFAGRRLDPVTGLYYYRNRYYDPSLGRFISQDTIGNWTDGMNLGNGLVYVGNRPVNWGVELVPPGAPSWWPEPGPGFWAELVPPAAPPWWPEPGPGFWVEPPTTGPTPLGFFIGPVRPEHPAPAPATPPPSPLGNWSDVMNLGNGLAYVGNNPVNRLDPYGTSGIDVKKLRIDVREWASENKGALEFLAGEAKKAAEPLIKGTQNYLLSSTFGNIIMCVGTQFAVAYYSSDNAVRSRFSFTVPITDWLGVGASGVIGEKFETLTWKIGFRW